MSRFLQAVHILARIDASDRLRVQFLHDEVSPVFLRQLMGKEKPRQWKTPALTDKRANKHQDDYERDIARTDKAKWNAHMNDKRAARAREKEAENQRKFGNLSREEKRERIEAKEAAQRKWETDLAAMREFNEARAAEQASRSDSEPSAK
jgi:hypothetical protein